VSTVDGSRTSPVREPSSRPRPVFGRGRGGGTNRGAILGLQVLVVVAVIGLWELAYVGKISDPTALPSPGSVGKELWTLLGTSAYWSSILHTLTTWALGLAIASVIAVPIGILIGASGGAYRASRATIDFARTLPPVALVPAVALLYGAKPLTALILVVFATTWPMLLQTMYGIRQVDPVARDTARTYRLGVARTVGFVWIPSALPFIATGLRIASTMSLFLAVGAELIAGPPGLGQSIAIEQASDQAVPMYAYIFTAACLGIVLTFLVMRVERRVLRWHSSYRPVV
jgi:ABC-type nitrate/sulfonate/bicarbonate transport system permease component